MTLFRTIHGSAHDIPLPDGSVQTIVTSPPYWGLRAYQGEQAVEWPAVTYAPMPGLPPLTVDAMTCDLGLEPDPVAYVGHLILCLREWRRVLRDDGVVFCNLGDSYNGSGGAGGDYAAGGLRAGQPKYPGRNVGALKPKDLVGMPWRFAFAAQADGWWLRSDIIGAKVAPMPESVTDRPTRAHEYIFLLTKNKTYYYDQEAVREQASEASIARIQQPNFEQQTGGPKDYANGTNPNRSHRQTLENFAKNPGRNLRSVWEWRPQPFPGAHFAVWPEAIPERCIRAGSSERGACPHCGAPWRRVVEIDRIDYIARQDRQTATGGAINGGVGKNFPTRIMGDTTWQPSCSCPAADPVPCVVLDPFSGSGTTGVVALKLGRAYVGVDISQEYLQGVTAERIGGGVQIGLGV